MRWYSLKEVLRAGFFSLAILVSTSFPSCQLPYKSTPPIASQKKPDEILKKGIGYIAKQDYAGARSYLEKYNQKDPSIEFVIAMSYAGDGTIFNGGLNRAGRNLENLIYDFENNPKMLKKMQEELKPLLKLEAYKRGKGKLKSTIWLAPKKLTPMYAWICTVEGDFETAAEYWKAAKHYWPEKVGDFRSAFHQTLLEANLQKDWELGYGMALIIDAIKDEVK